MSEALAKLQVLLKVDELDSSGDNIPKFKTPEGSGYTAAGEGMPMLSHHAFPPKPAGGVLNPDTKQYNYHHKEADAFANWTHEEKPGDTHRIYHGDYFNVEDHQKVSHVKIPGWVPTLRPENSDHPASYESASARLEDNKRPPIDLENPDGNDVADAFARHREVGAYTAGWIETEHELHEMLQDDANSWRHGHHAIQNMSNGKIHRGGKEVTDLQEIPAFNTEQNNEWGEFFDRHKKKSTDSLAKLQELLRKEGGGGDGGGDSGGGVFTSDNSGIFTPTYGSDKKRKRGIKKSTEFAIELLKDVLVDFTKSEHLGDLNNATSSHYKDLWASMTDSDGNAVFDSSNPAHQNHLDRYRDHFDDRNTDHEFIDEALRDWASDNNYDTVNDISPGYEDDMRDWSHKVLSEAGLGEKPITLYRAHDKSQGLNPPITGATPMSTSRKAAEQFADPKGYPDRTVSEYKVHPKDILSGFHAAPHIFNQREPWATPNEHEMIVKPRATSGLDTPTVKDMGATLPLQETSLRQSESGPGIGFHPGPHKADTGDQPQYRVIQNKKSPAQELVEEQTGREFDDKGRPSAQEQQRFNMVQHDVYENIHLGKSEDGVLAKSRVYVDNPGAAPEGFHVQQGPKGGWFYETSRSRPPTVNARVHADEEHPSEMEWEDIIESLEDGEEQSFFQGVKEMFDYINDLRDSDQGYGEQFNTFTSRSMDGQVLGMAWGNTQPGYEGEMLYDIGQFGVLPHARNSGTTQQMLAGVEESAAKQGVDFLSVTPLNDKVKEFWEKEGFHAEHQYDEESLIRPMTHIPHIHGAAEEVVSTPAGDFSQEEWDQMDEEEQLAQYGTYSEEQEQADAESLGVYKGVTASGFHPTGEQEMDGLSRGKDVDDDPTGLDNEPSEKPFQSPAGPEEVDRLGSNKKAKPTLTEEEMVLDKAINESISGRGVGHNESWRSQGDKQEMEVEKPYDIVEKGTTGQGAGTDGPDLPHQEMNIQGDTPSPLKPKKYPKTEPIEGQTAPTMPSSGRTA